MSAKKRTPCFEAFMQTRMAWVNATGREPLELVLDTGAFLRLAAETGQHDPSARPRFAYVQPLTFTEFDTAHEGMIIVYVGRAFTLMGVTVREA